MFWSSEGFYFLPCTPAEVALLSRAVSLYRAWTGLISRGLALVEIGDTGLEALEAQLARPQVEPGSQQVVLRLEAEGVESLQAAVSDAIEALRDYRHHAPFPEPGILGMVEDYFGAELRDPAVATQVLTQLEAISQRLELDVNEEV